MLLNYVLAMLLCALALFAASGIAAAPVRSNTPLIAIDIAGNEFRIPADYFIRSLPRSRDLTSFLIHAFLPKLEPVKGHEKEEFSENGVSRTAIILALNAASTPTLGFRLHTREETGAPYERRSEKYGLEVEIPSDLQVENGRERDEIYINKAGSELIGFIICDLDGRFPSPGCTHEFLYRNLLLSVTYRKEFLPSWLSIEQSIKRLLDSFMRQASVSTRLQSYT